MTLPSTVSIRKGSLCSRWTYLFRECCSHMTAPSSASWSRFSPSSNSVNQHVSTMWFVVWRWPQSQEGDRARPHFCHRCKNVQIKIKKRLKNVKNVKKWKTFVNVIKKLPLLSVVQLHAWCPRNGLQCNSEYAIQFNFLQKLSSF